MGDLIVMKRSTGPSPRETSFDTSAEILFFTGVRYQRMPDEPVVVAPMRRRSQKAKTAAQARKLKRLA